MKHFTHLVFGLITALHTLLPSVTGQANLSCSSVLIFSYGPYAAFYYANDGTDKVLISTSQPLLPLTVTSSLDGTANAVSFADSRTPPRYLKMVDSNTVMLSQRDGNSSFDRNASFLLQVAGDFCNYWRISIAQDSNQMLRHSDSYIRVHSRATEERFPGDSAVAIHCTNYTPLCASQRLLLSVSGSFLSCLTDGSPCQLVTSQANATQLSEQTGVSGEVNSVSLQSAANPAYFLTAVIHDYLRLSLSNKSSEFNVSATFRVSFAESGKDCSGRRLLLTGSSAGALRRDGSQQLKAVAWNPNDYTSNAVISVACFTVTQTESRMSYLAVAAILSGSVASILIGTAVVVILKTSRRPARGNLAHATRTQAVNRSNSDGMIANYPPYSEVDYINSGTRNCTDEEYEQITAVGPAHVLLVTPELLGSGLDDLYINS